jgi:O-antigen ligase
MQRSGLSTRLGIEYNEPFPHPHNAYLELFLDNGFVLGLPILIFFFILLRYALQMVKVKNNPTCNTIGGVAIAYIVAFLVGAFGLQSFYPMQGTFSLWCAVGILIRGHMDLLPIKSTAQTKPSWEEKTDGPML